jgi:hypothetical protein
MKGCEHSDRMGFIRKVFCILLAQFSITAAVVWGLTANVEGYCVGSPPVCYVDPGNTVYWMINNYWLLIIAIITLIFTEITLICCRKVARKVPINYILLLIFTLCESYLLADICAYYMLSQPGVVIMSVMGTATISLACMLYAFFAKTDFTIMGGLIWLLSFSLMLLILF